VTSCLCKSNQMVPQDIFIAGFTDGTIRVYKYPVLYDRAEFIEFDAHRGPVGSVCITIDNQHIVSAGTDDSTLIVWKLTPIGFEEFFSLSN
jgi:microtubule-associated protein-like 1/2